MNQSLEVWLRDGNTVVPTPVGVMRELSLLLPLLFFKKPQLYHTHSTHSTLYDLAERLKDVIVIYRIFLVVDNRILLE